MKFTELPDHVIEAAAKTLSRELEGVSTWEDDKRTEKAKDVAESVRDSFIQLCSEEKMALPLLIAKSDLAFRSGKGKILILNLFCRTRLQHTLNHLANLKSTCKIV